MMEKIVQVCPGLQEIERLVLDWLNPRPANIQILAHLKECPRCEKKFRHLVKFYKILNRELRLPVSQSVINFIKKIEGDKVSLSQLILKPLPQDGECFHEFRSNIVAISSDITKLKFYGAKSHYLVIRIFHDEYRQQTCFSIVAQKPQFYQNVELNFIDLGLSYYTNLYGLGKMDVANVALFDDQIVRITPLKVHTEPRD
ncbi:hypothetical protein JW964_11080 [candidate division KSB1 bacterium]|nr:hypothetical protein [candidate division KSB1 bacterium]